MALKTPFSNTLSLPIDFLRTFDEPQLNFDIYIRAGGKPILYCRGDDIRLKERIQRLNSKENLTHFLVVKDQYNEFIQYISNHLDQVFDGSRGESLREQVQAIYQQQKSLLVVYSSDLSSSENYQVLRNSCSSFYNFFVHSEQGLSELFCHLSLEDDLQEKWAAHSIRTAALACPLISQLADEAGRPIFEVIQGAFLHDIAYIKTPWDLQISDPALDLAFKEHPTEGWKITDYPFVHSWARNTIRLHEEHVDGSGFPQGATGDDIDPAILCVAVAGAFDHYITIEKMPPEKALKQILIDKMGCYPLEYLQKIQELAKSMH